MKNGYIKDHIEPVKTTFKNDTNVSVSEYEFSTLEGIRGHYCELFSGAVDHKINNNAIMSLTDKKYAKNIFTLSPTDPNLFPRVINTYFVLNQDPARFFINRLGANKNDFPSSDPSASFLNIEELTNDEIDNRFYTISSVSVYEPVLDFVGIISNRLFQLELLDNTKCKINHEDGFTRTCLTYSSSGANSNCTFEILDEDVGSNPPADHPQVFNYNLNDAEGYIALTKTLPGSGGMVYIIHDVDASHPQDNDRAGGQLVGLDPAESDGFPVKSILKIRRQSTINTPNAIARSIDTRWYRYSDNWSYYNQARVDDSRATIRNLSKDTTKYYLNSYEILPANFLLDMSYTGLTGNELYYSVTPLKNQLTPAGFQGENNPHTVAESSEFCLDFQSRKNTDYRTYHSIFSGTNQIQGDESMHLGYTSFVDTIELKGDRLTYFHMPNSMKPYTWMNINYRRVPEYPNRARDGAEYGAPWQKLPVAVPESFNYNYEDHVGLLRAGAIAGSTPVASDKIFKKRADYRYYSTWGDAGLPGNRNDSHYGTWLCSWLQAPPDDDSEKRYGPVWMDRYYDDTKYSENQAMQLPSNCTTGFLGLRSNNNSSWVDVPSELRLERGVQYAYHHIGNRDNSNIIKAFSKYEFHSDLNNYTETISGVNNTVLAEYEGDTKVYKFNGNRFGRTASPDPAHGDFRISFWMYSDNWEKNFGHQVFGNYVDDGVGVVNDNVITPFGIIVGEETDPVTSEPKHTEVVIANTAGDTLVKIPKSLYTDTRTGENPVIKVCRDEPIGIIYVIASVPDYCLITMFNINGIIQDVKRIDGSLESGTAIFGRGNLVDVQVNNEQLFMLFENSRVAVSYNIPVGEVVEVDDNSFAFAEVTGLESAYNGYYFKNYSIGLVGGRTVYEKASVNDDLASWLAWDQENGRWFLTGDPTIAPDQINYVANPGVPETLVSETGITDLEGRISVAYNEETPRTIWLDGNPSLTLSYVNESSNFNRLVLTEDGYLFIVNCEDLCVSPKTSRGGTNKIYFTKHASIFSSSLTPLEISKTEDTKYANEVLRFGSNQITNIRQDRDGYFWVSTIKEDAGEGHFLTRLTPQFEIEWTNWINGNLYVRSSPTGDASLYNEPGRQTRAAFDLVSEYAPDGKLDHYGVYFMKSDPSVAQQAGAKVDNLMDVIRVDKDGKTTVMGVVDNTISGYIQPTKSLTNYDRFHYLYKTPKNTLTFKFVARNKFNPRDFIKVSEDFDVSPLASGWHHFCFGFDANLLGIGYFYVDGRLIKPSDPSKKFHSTHKNSELGKYGFTKVLDKTCMVGATQSNGNIALGDYIKRPGYYYTSNMAVKSVRMYNFNLFHDFVRALAREHISIDDMNWVIPSGRRSHLDHVDKFHIHRLPGFKTSDFKIDLVDVNIPFESRTITEQSLDQTIAKFKPVSNGTVEYVWHSDNTTT